MVGQISLVYVTPEWFDENILHSPTLLQAANVTLQFDVLPQQLLSNVALSSCVNAIKFPACVSQ